MSFRQSFLAALTATAAVSMGLVSTNLLAATTPDVVIAIEGTPTVTIENGQKFLNFDVRFQNDGTPINTTIRSKALLIPKNDYEANPGLKGVVLPTFDVALNLATGATIVHSAHLALPNVAEHEYLLGAVADLTLVAGEGFAEAMNNTTRDLVDVGVLSNTIANDTRDPILGIDVYHEVHTKFDLRNSRATHRSRMIMRGDRNTVTWNNTIWARFMIVDLAGEKLYMSSYNGSTIDKFWGAISWNAEHDKSGRAIQVDYYTNAPSTAGLAPGKYLMAILLNSRDLLPEPYPENNLDLTAFTFETPSVANNREIWLVPTTGTQAQQTLTMQTPVDVSVQGRSYEITSLNFLTIPTLTGTFVSTSALLNTPVTLNAGLEVGSYSGTLEIVENGATDHPTLVPVKAFVHGEARPALTLPSTAVTLTSQQGLDPVAQTFVISNTGNATLDFSLVEDEPWFSVSPSQGQVAPGQSLTVTVAGKHYAQRPTTVAGQITVYSSANSTASRVTVSYQVQVRTPSPN